MEPITYDEFKTAVRASRRAWHLELRDTYSVEAEDEPFARFLDGEHDDYAWMDEWLAFIRKVADAGIAVQRLRIVSVPHSDYTRWGLALAPRNIEAGEEVRYLRRDLVGGVVLPDEDCWLLDDDTLILSVFSEDGRAGGFAREPDSELAARYRTFRDKVWPQAVPHATYTAS